MDGHETDEAPHDGPDDLLPALEVIEQQPLAARATAYSAVLDDLARRLESGPAGA
ncbi:hypothetical protein [Microbacterium sp. cx-59]|uniref:hypothetical protein n=1 Tax=Microbacterium sp. cx-59 TaxID=2891207 RepID=UPI001E63D3A8|nr:hypothetical protein [Microbacterium sp. cx-59]MCC4907822.1 hypothetical protein [Microbacterium sp. cx-59]